MKKRKLTFPALSTELAASAWCQPSTKKIVMDIRLAEAFRDILDREMSKPALGCATTGELIAELKARSILNYSTVFPEKVTKPKSGLAANQKRHR